MTVRLEIKLILVLDVLPVIMMELKKVKTIIGDNSFIGSNTSLIAPVKIGNNVKIGAGSVINKDISANKLAIRRSKLKIY